MKGRAREGRGGRESMLGQYRTVEFYCMPFRLGYWEAERAASARRNVPGPAR